jgi:hypothetical protein
VRDRPFGIDAVAAEAAAELVEDAALAHAPERRVGHRRFAAAQAQLEVGRVRKFRRAAKAAVLRVKACAQRFQRRAQRLGIERLPGVAGARLQPREREPQLLALLADRRALLAPDLGDALQDLDEAGQPVARALRKVGAAPERRAVGGEKHGERPAAAALRQHLVRGLVDLVDVGPFLAIHLDVDEMPVHDRRHLGILEAFLRHDVAPVAGRIAYGQQDRLVLNACAGERRLVPRLPGDGIVRVLLQIRRRLAGEAIAHRCCRMVSSVSR